MKKLLIAATLTAAALGATSLMADPGHQRGQHQGAAAAGHPMAEHGQGAAEHAAQHGARHAQMQKRMQDMHARMGSHERHGQGPRAQDHHQH